jgi:hypothetical protein
MFFKWALLEILRKGNQYPETKDMETCGTI